MKKVIAILAVCSLFSCSKMNEQVVSNESLCVSTETEKEYYDASVSAVAKSVSSALRENESFRKLVISEVKKQFDGDYDVLLKDIVGKSVYVKTKSGESFDMSVKDLLNSYMEEPVTKSQEDFLDELQRKYPGTQISVPVKADKWEPDYIPVVCFIDSNYDDTKTEYVTGYDSEGNTVLVDAINEPDLPVVVVSQNERMDYNCNISLSSFGDPSGWGTVGPTDPIDLNTSDLHLAGMISSNIKISGEYTSNSIVLNINSIHAPDFVKSYNVYRAKQGEDFQLVRSSLITYSQNTRYVDSWVLFNTEYTYYVEAEVIYSSGGKGTCKSDKFTFITNTAVPKPVESLEVRPVGKGQVKLSWENPDLKPCTIHVEKLIYNVPNAKYTTVAVLNPSETDFVDGDNLLGHYVEYKVTRYDAYGKISPKREAGTFIPYRDPSTLSRIYVNRIACDLQAVEGWLYGKPEFCIKAAYLSVTGDTLQSSMHKYKFDSRTSANNCNIEVMTWPYMFDSKNCEYVTIHLFEEDYVSGTVELMMSLALGFIYKNYIEAKVAASLNLKYNIGGSEDCGEGTIGYFENPETRMHLGYGSYLDLSEGPVYR